MNAGEIHLAIFPFGGSLGSKPRPVLMLTGLLGTVPEVLLAYITSVIPPTGLLPTDLLLDPSLPDYAGTGLKKASLLRLHRLATLHQSRVIRQLGVISPATQAEVDSRLRILLRL